MLSQGGPGCPAPPPAVILTGERTGPGSPAMPEPRAPTSRAAVASLVLGAASLLLLAGCLTGLPALLLGLSALRAVNTSGGKLRGRRLASAGLVLGAAGTLLTAVGLAAILAGAATRRRDRLECVNHLRRIGVG